MRQEDEAALQRRADDLIELNALRRKPQFIGFLDERQVYQLRAYFQRTGFEGCRFYGGYPEASRCFLGVDVWQDEIGDGAFPFVLISFSFRRQDVLTHRDFLGALMALGVKRECVGDILVAKGQAAVFADRNVADYIITQVRKIGRVGVKAQLTDKLTVSAEEKFRLIEGTVPSLRLDCVVSLATGLSREKTRALLAEKLVSYRYQVCQNPSEQLEEGEIFSVRGYGKFVLNTVGSFTKKGRIHITIKHFI